MSDVRINLEASILQKKKTSKNFHPFVIIIGPSTSALFDMFWIPIEIKFSLYTGETNDYTNMQVMFSSDSTYNDVPCIV